MLGSSNNYVNWVRELPGAQGAIVLKDSAGRLKQRLQFNELADAVFNVAYLEASNLLGKLALLFTRRWAPMKVGDKILLVNIASIIKRLGISEESLRKAAKTGDISAVVQARVNELKTSGHVYSKQLRAGLTSKQIAKINYWVDYAVVNESGYTHLSRKIIPDLPYSVTIRKDKDNNKEIYVHASRCGEGAGKVVKACMDWITGNVYARVLPKKDGIKKFRSEKAVRKTLDNDTGNFVKVIKDYDIKNKPDGCLLEFFPENLLDLCDSYCSISLDSKINLMIQVASDVEVMHAKRIIHCDLKLENILVDKEKNSAKVNDFDLAADLTNVNDVVGMSSRGTPNYLTPEYLRKGKYRNKKSDSDFITNTQKTLIGRLQKLSIETADLKECVNRINGARKYYMAAIVLDDLTIEVEIAESACKILNNQNASEEMKMKAQRQLEDLVLARGEKIDAYTFGCVLEELICGLGRKDIKGIMYNGQKFDLTGTEPQVKAINKIICLINQLKHEDPVQRMTISEAKKILINLESKLKGVTLIF